MGWESYSSVPEVEVERRPARKKRRKRSSAPSALKDSSEVSILVHQQKAAEQSPASAKHMFIRSQIDAFASQFGIAVEESDREEPGRSAGLRGDFTQEAAQLQDCGLHFPETVAFTEYDSKPSQQKMVFKNVNESRGRAKFLLTKNAQLDTLRQWMERYGNPEDWIVQEYIETPTKRPLSYRVLVDATGHRIASQVLYSGKSNDERMKLNRFSLNDIGDKPIRALECPETQYFLDATNIASNRTYVIPPEKMPANGVQFTAEEVDDHLVGGRIVLDGLHISHAISDDEAQILSSLGIEGRNPVDASLPLDVGIGCSAIAEELCMNGRQVQELLLGIDVLQERETDRQYVAEINRRSMLECVRDLHGHVDVMSDNDAWHWTLKNTIRRIAEKYSPKKK